MKKILPDQKLGWEAANTPAMFKRNSIKLVGLYDAISDGRLS